MWNVDSSGSATCLAHAGLVFCATALLDIAENSGGSHAMEQKSILPSRHYGNISYSESVQTTLCQSIGATPFQIVDNYKPKSFGRF